MAVTLAEAYRLRDQLDLVKSLMEIDMVNGDPPLKYDVREALRIADEAISELMAVAE